MKRFLLPAFALALAVNANATSIQANMAAEQQTETAQNSQTYKGKLTVYQEGDVMGEPSDATIIVSEENDGTYTFILKNFSISLGGEPTLIGDATVSGIYPKKENGEIILEAENIDAPITGGISSTLKDNKVVMTMKATIGEFLNTKVLKADISYIGVTFAGSDFTLTVNAIFTPEMPNQIAGDFDEAWVNCIPWDSGKGKKKEYGTQPNGWTVSNVTASSSIVAKSVEGFNKTGYAVKIENVSAVYNQKVPGYLTLGTPWATAHFVGVVKNADGGTFGGKKFTYRPDAISFDYQRDNSKGKENATAIAYIWKGYWTQTNVPGNTGIFANPTPCTMINRDRNILGNETSATLGDKPAKPSEGAKLIAKLEQSISESTKGTWKSMTIPFTYNDKTAVPEYINVIFAANDYFGDRNGIVAGNSLTIDNVKLVYYHALNSLTYNGNKVANFDEGTTEYTLNGKLAEDFDKVKFTIKGAGATYDVAKDEVNNVATITVKGNDYDVNPSSKTVYTIKFDGTVGINGITTSTNTANSAIYDLSGRQLKTMQKGINIVRGKDGKMIKVMK